eukprot:4320920-Amphidinium_carterae.1
MATASCCQSPLTGKLELSVQRDADLASIHTVSSGLSQQRVNTTTPEKNSASHGLKCHPLQSCLNRTWDGIRYCTQ